jgi:UrcA family protein
MSVRLTILAAAAVAASLCNLGLAAAPAVAQPVDGILVSYADLNLANQAGRRVLDHRIATAATQLCGTYGVTELSWAAAVRACQDDTIAGAQPQRDAAIGIRGTVRIGSAERFIRVNRAAN